MEPMTGMMIASLASSLLGPLLGGGGDNERHPYSGGLSAQNSLETAMNAIKGFGSKLEQRGAPQLRSSYVQEGPKPVNIPGLGFQIGGGLGQDPALRDPSLLQGSFDPGTMFQGMYAAGSPQGARRRSPASTGNGMTTDKKPKASTL